MTLRQENREWKRWIDLIPAEEWREMSHIEMTLLMGFQEFYFKDYRFKVKQRGVIRK